MARALSGAADAERLSVVLGAPHGHLAQFKLLPPVGDLGVWVNYPHWVWDAQIHHTTPDGRRIWVAYPHSSDCRPITVTVDTESRIVLAESQVATGTAKWRFAWAGGDQSPSPCGNSHSLLLDVELDFQWAARDAEPTGPRVERFSSSTGYQTRVERITSRISRT